MFYIKNQKHVSNIRIPVWLSANFRYKASFRKSDNGCILTKAFWKK